MYYSDTYHTQLSRLKAQAATTEQEDVVTGIVVQRIDTQASDDHAIDTIQQNTCYVDNS